MELDTSNFCKYWESHLLQTGDLGDRGILPSFPVVGEMTAPWEGCVWVGSLMLKKEKSSVPVSLLLRQPEKDLGAFIICKVYL